MGTENLFVPQEKLSAVDVVINSIKELLITRKLMPGDRLPNELEISKGLGISRGSVREAMKILKAYGLIDIRVGDGTYIATSLRKGMIEPLLFSFLLSERDIGALSQLRKVIEMDILEMIIQNKDQNEDVLNQLEANLNALKQLQSKQAPKTDFVQNDLEFHRLMGMACGNVLMEKIYGFILDYLWTTIDQTHEKQELGKAALEAHTLIWEAIQSDDPLIAEQAIVHSVDIWKYLQ